MFPAFLLPTKGYAVASINYRLSEDAVFPAQIDDCRAAIDWLISKSKLYGLDQSRIGVWGGSAGAHLAALLGLGYGENTTSTNNRKVKAVCDWCGPTDLTTICHQYPDGASCDEGKMRSMITRLLGMAPEDCPHLARQASPSTYIDSSAPPFLIMHGDKDPTVPLVQSKIFSQRLIARGVDCSFVVVHGGKHDFYSFEMEKQVVQFFDKSLKIGESQLSATRAQSTNNFPCIQPSAAR
jgi:acetyl esterase/lipase